MTIPAIRRARLRSHLLDAPAATVLDAARRMLAVQAQEFWAGRWALAARSAGAPSIRDVDTLFDRGELVRAWTMRGTLHTILARDLPWVLEVTAQRQIRAAAPRLRALGLGAEELGSAERGVRAALRGGNRMTRPELFSVLERCGIDPREQRGLHALQQLALRGVLCQGPVVPRDDGVTREQGFVLIEEHIADAGSPADPLAELFVRYLEGHGPATPADFAWWSGLTLGTARSAAERAAERLEQHGEGLYAAAGQGPAAAARRSVLALGAFEEYYISYADRAVAGVPELRRLVGPTVNGQVRPIVVADGEVVGTWKHSTALGRQEEQPVIELFEGAAVSEAEVSSALDRYLSFVRG